MATDGAIGLVLGSAVAPSEIPRAAADAEHGGFDEIWLAEDFFFTGGISGASAALAATRQATVGLGVVSAMVRHPALLAMEISSPVSGSECRPGSVRWDSIPAPRSPRCGSASPPSSNS